MEEIRQVLGEDAVSIEDEILHAHGYSEWSTINVDRLPVAVTFPSSTEEVAVIAKICHKRRVPMSMYNIIEGANCADRMMQFLIQVAQALRAISLPYTVASVLTL